MNHDRAFLLMVAWRATEKLKNYEPYSARVVDPCTIQVTCTNGDKVTHTLVNGNGTVDFPVKPPYYYATFSLFYRYDTSGEISDMH